MRRLQPVTFVGDVNVPPSLSRESTVIGPASCCRRDYRYRLRLPLVKNSTSVIHGAGPLYDLLKLGSPYFYSRLTNKETTGVTQIKIVRITDGER